MEQRQFLPFCTVIAAIVVCSFAVSEPAGSDIRLGVESDEPAPDPSGTPIVKAPAAGATVIDFDDVARPCAFAFAVALRDEYAALGVHFDGMIGPNDGGAILDECSFFDVTGFSAPNFLAFNNLAVLDDGGVAQPPELISFDFAITSFQINAGVGLDVTGDVTIEARNSSGAVVDSSSITVAPGMQTLSVTGVDIRTIEVTSTAIAFAMDDLAIVAGTPVSTLPSSLLVVLALVLAILGVSWISNDERLEVL